jgi:sugar phosphate isomerase/epimerase
MRTAVDQAGLRVTDIDGCGDWLQDGARPDFVSAPFRSVWRRPDFFDAAAELGADTIVAVDLTGRDIRHEEAVEAFAGLCDDAVKHGLRVALEFMPFSGISDLRAAWDVVQQANRRNAGLVVDVCHFARSGWDDALLRTIPPERIMSVQLGDGPRLPPTDLVDEAMYHRALPGDGDFDVAGVLEILPDGGTRTRVGPEIYQRSWADRPAAETAALLMASTRRALETATRRGPGL